MHLKETIEAFVYPHLESLSRRMADGGKDTTWMGIPLLDDKENFTGGALMLAVSHLLVYQLEHTPERAEETLQRWLTFAGWAAEKPMNTWGKLSALKSLRNIKRAGKWEAVPAALLDTLNARTDLRDFFDTETMQLRGYATNYLHVAMAVAGHRAKLGWEKPGLAEKIFALFLQHIRARSSGGWMDDSAGYGRFDRYSFVIYAELADTCRALDIPIVQQVKDGVCQSVELVLDFCSPQGDGVAYGRSLSAHGDMTVPAVVSTAVREGWLPEEQRQRAADCCRTCLAHIMDYWYNSEKQSFDLWFDGRTTNRYRRIHRLLEVNLDLSDQLLAAVANLEAGGMTDLPADPAPAAPQTGVDCVKTEFIAPNNALYVLHTPQRIWQLPVVGTGEIYRYPAYYPLPVSPRFLEQPPENPADGSALPLFVPLAELEDGRVAMPVQYFAGSSCRKTEQGVEVEIRLESLCIMGGEAPQPLADSRAALRYVFGEDGTVWAEFAYVSQTVPIRALRLQWMSQSALLRQEPDTAAFADCTVYLPDWTQQPAAQVETNEDYFTPHGPGRWLIACEKPVNSSTAKASWTLI